MNASVAKLIADKSNLTNLDNTKTSALNNVLTAIEIKSTEGNYFLEINLDNEDIIEYVRKSLMDQGYKLRYIKGGLRISWA